MDSGPTYSNCFGARSRSRLALCINDSDTAYPSLLLHVPVAECTGCCMDVAESLVGDQLGVIAFSPIYVE